MQVQRIAIATMAALAVDGCASLGSGTAFADPPGANASGGTSPADVFQQATAQQGRQNNHCSSPNAQSDVLGPTGARAKGRCVTDDDSFTELSAFRSGGADAAGGSNSDVSLLQQNAAQRGQRNNHCANPNSAGFIVSGDSLEADCQDRNTSYNHAAFVQGGGAEANGGTTGASLEQQNIAQEGRQSNNCGNPNNLDLALSGGRATTQCEATDESKNLGSHDE